MREARLAVAFLGLHPDRRRELCARFGGPAALIRAVRELNQDIPLMAQVTVNDDAALLSGGSLESSFCGRALPRSMSVLSAMKTAKSARGAPVMPRAIRPKMMVR